MTAPTGEPGSAGSDPNAQGGTGTPGTDPATGQAPQSGQPPTSPEPTTGQPAKTAAELQAELEATRRRMQAADQNNAKLQADLKKLQDAQLSEQDRLKRDHEEATKRIAALEEENHRLRLQNSFVTDKTYDWHDPQAALKLADLSEVKVDEKGVVTGLKEAIKAVADANPWMLKPKDDGGSGGSQQPPAGSTGATGTPGRQPTGPDRTALEKRFPAMRGRVSS
jgi:hypothetical protein